MWHGGVLRDLRQDKKMTTQALADELKVSRAYISQLEGGRRTPTDAFTLKLAEYFGVSPQIFNRLRVIAGGSTTESPATDTTPDNQPRTDAPKVNQEIHESHSEHSTRLTLFMLLGLVKGVLEDIRERLLADSDKISTHVLTGVLIQDMSDSEPLGVFQLVSTREWLSLQINSKVRVHLLTDVTPHVTLSDSAVGVGNEGQSELIWFTGYASTYCRYHQCRIWTKQAKGVKIHDQSLNEYYQHGVNGAMRSQ